MIPLWLFIPTAVLAVVAVFGWVRALKRADRRVDRILAQELYHPLVSDEEAADRAEREGGHG